MNMDAKRLNQIRNDHRNHAVTEGLLRTWVAELLTEMDRLREENARERDRIVSEIQAEIDDLAGQEGATLADERVITALSNGLSRALRIVQAGDPR